MVIRRLLISANARLVTGGWSILPEETKCDRGVLKVNSSDSDKYSVWPFAK